MKFNQRIFFLNLISFALVSCGISLPIYVTNGSGAISCTNQNCVAVGQYYSIGNSHGLPLVVFSDNEGQSFDHASPVVLPPDANKDQDAQLYGISCAGLKCVTVGVYNLIINFPTISAQPVVIVSTDGGKNFTIPMTAPLPPDADSTKISGLRDVAISNKRIIGVGLYNFDPTLPVALGVPLVIVSDKNGAKFINSYQPNLPSNATIPNNAMIYSIDCVKKHCVAVGVYMATPANIPYPLILISDDEGQSFAPVAKISISNDVNTTDPTKGMQLQAVTCNELHCVAVGNYYKTGDIGSLPLVLVSDDGGLTFSMSSMPSLPSDRDDTLIAGLKAISCTGLHCVAGGFYNFDTSNTTGAIALSMFSNDGGVTFEKVPDVPLPADADQSKISEITGLSCLNTNCTGVGIYNFNVDNMSVLHGSPLAVFGKEKSMVFTSASQPTLPLNADLTKANTLGNINP